ncbi:MAG: Uma2 family endonuclease [Stenomitos rutilans HA7619-LM2]|jgi:Uma2 family endonuclease|nr:Uma2 family endonuclease [Stenomitos rutilans HA7619-LM2]
MDTDTAIALRRLSVHDYYRMAESGIFQSDERVELLEGQIIQMAAKGTAHRAAVTRIQRLFDQRLGDRVLICLQDPVQLNDYSEPEPDIAILVPDPLDYEEHHPTASEVYLLIEVSDATLKFDREVKAPPYARAGIAEYWVLDVNARKLHVYRVPSADGYQSEAILSEALTIAPLAFPECVITVGEMLRSHSAA